jgi:phage-related minor tail protein
LRNWEPHAKQVGNQMTIFGVRAGPAMQALISQGSGALRAFTTVLENSGGRAKEVANVQMAGFNGAMRELRSAFEGLQIAIADSGLLEFVTELVRGLSGLVRSLGNVNPRFMRTGVVIAGLAAVVGPLLIAVGDGAETLCLIDGHGKNRVGIGRRPFANSNTGWLGMTVRSRLRHAPSLRPWMYAKIDCSHDGSTTVRIRRRRRHV